MPTVPDSRRELGERVEREAYALCLVARHPRTPPHAKVLAGLLVAYAVSPVEPIPDAVPVVGYLDKALLLPAGAALVLRPVPGGVVAECRQRAEGDLDAGRARWVVGGVVVLAWTVAGFLLARALPG